MAVAVQIGSVLILGCPAVGALFALMLLLMDAGWSKKDIHRENHVLMAYFLTTIVNLAQLVSYHFNSDFYVWTTPLGLMTYGLIQIFFYWFVFELTRMDANEKFPKIHFVLPFVLSVFLWLMISGNKSIEHFVEMVNGMDRVANHGYLVLYMANVYVMKLFFGVGYIVFSTVRLLKYNRFIRDYSANEEKASLRWLWFLLTILVIAMPFPLIWLGLKGKMLASQGALLVYSMLLLYFYVYLTLHVLRKDRFRVLVELEPLLESPATMVSSVAKSGDSSVSKKSVLRKSVFEDYILKEKPYLNQDLRITDLVDVFHVNRTYISSFINVEYNMNFSTYINNHRMVEFNRLCGLPECKHKSKQELVEMAGFNSYRSFLRIKNGAV